VVRRWEAELTEALGGGRGWWDWGGTEEGTTGGVEKREREVDELDPPLVGWDGGGLRRKVDAEVVNTKERI
jgi:hypothetical protein